jgi:hypothetical protein
MARAFSAAWSRRGTRTHRSVAISPMQLANFLRKTRRQKKRRRTEHYFRKRAPLTPSCSAMFRCQERWRRPHPYVRLAGVPHTFALDLRIAPDPPHGEAGVNAVSGQTPRAGIQKDTAHFHAIWPRVPDLQSPTAMLERRWGKFRATSCARAHCGGSHGNPYPNHLPQAAAPWDFPEPRFGLRPLLAPARHKGAFGRSRWSW